MRKLSSDEYERIKKYLNRRCKPRTRLLFALLRCTGFRIKEILSLRIGDVINPDGTITGEINIPPRFMKKKVARPPVCVHPALKESLQEYMAHRFPEGAPTGKEALIPSQKGGSISYVQAWRIVKNVFDACDVYGDVAVHSLRKTFCQAVYKNTGNDIVATQKIMGHTSPMNTLKYLEVDRQLMRQAVTTMEV